MLIWNSLTYLITKKRRWHIVVHSSTPKILEKTSMGIYVKRNTMASSTFQCWIIILFWIFRVKKECSMIEKNSKKSSFNFTLWEKWFLKFLTFTEINIISVELAMVVPTYLLWHLKYHDVWLVHRFPFPTYKTFIDCFQTLLNQSSMNLSHFISSQNEREREFHTYQTLYSNQKPWNKN